MNTIKVNANSLEAANMAIKAFKEHLSKSIIKCESELKKQFTGIDDNYRKELLDFIEELRSFEKDTRLFEAENAVAIKDRLSKTFDYSKTSYKRRNIL